MPLPNSLRASVVLAGVEAVTVPIVPTSTRNPLLTRIATGIVLIAVAIAAVWLGGTVFSALVAAAILTMFAEWAVMHRMGRGLRLAGLAVLAGVVLLMTLVSVNEAVVALAGGAGLLGLFARRMQRGSGFWVSAGVLYCGLPAIALVWLRGHSLGLEAVIWLLAIVWTTDIAAFFAGRAIGGAKLMPSVSPNKTWAGAIGGVIGAAVVGGGLAAALLVGHYGASAVRIPEFVALAIALSVLSILGDLFESGLKRRAGVKDSGTILPGHGGVLDRLDGLVPVAVAGGLAFAWTGWAG